MSSGYEKLYKAGGFGYDEHVDKWREWVAEHYVRSFGLTAGARLLDVGCGDGFWAALFHEAGFEVAGIDRSTAAIEVAQQRLPGAEFVVGDIAEPLPFAEQSFDIAFARGLSHFGVPDLDTPQTRTAFENVMQTVRPDGTLLVSLYTTLDETSSGTWYNARASRILGVLEHVGRPAKLEMAGNYLQVAVTRTA